MITFKVYIRLVPMSVPSVTNTMPALSSTPVVYVGFTTGKSGGSRHDCSVYFLSTTIKWQFRYLLRIVNRAKMIALRGWAVTMFGTHRYIKLSAHCEVGWARLDTAKLSYLPRV